MPGRVQKTLRIILILWYLIFVISCGANICDHTDTSPYAELRMWTGIELHFFEDQIIPFLSCSWEF